MCAGLISEQRAQWAIMILTSLVSNTVYILYGDDKLSLENEQGESENKGKDITARVSNSRRICAVMHTSRSVCISVYSALL